MESAQACAALGAPWQTPYLRRNQAEKRIPKELWLSRFYGAGLCFSLNIFDLRSDFPNKKTAAASSAVTAFVDRTKGMMRSS